MEPRFVRFNGTAVKHRVKNPLSDAEDDFLRVVEVVELVIDMNNILDFSKDTGSRFICHSCDLDNYELISLMMKQDYTITIVHPWKDFLALFGHPIENRTWNKVVKEK